MVLSTELGGVSDAWQDVVYVTAKVADTDRTVVPDAVNRIHFSVTGPGKIVAVDNAYAVDHEPFEATEHDAFQGRAVAIMRATADAGGLHVTAEANGLGKATVMLMAVPANKVLSGPAS